MILREGEALLSSRVESGEKFFCSGENNSNKFFCFTFLRGARGGGKKGKKQAVRPGKRLDYGGRTLVGF